MTNASAVSAAINELSGFEVFEGLQRTDIEKLCQQATLVVSDHKGVLFHFEEEAQFFGLVLSGAYKLSKPTPQGDDIIIHFSTPGDVIGALIMHQEIPKYPVTVTSMGPSRFLKIPRRVFLEVWTQYPQLILKTQSLLSQRMAQIQSHKVNLKAPLSTKVASLLMEILSRNPSKEGLIPYPLTRQEIADNLGASVESVIRIMSQWSKSGYLETNDQYIRILQPDKIIECMTNT